MWSARVRITAIFAAGLAATALIVVTVISAARTSTLFDDQADVAVTHAKLAMTMIAQEHQRMGVVLVTDSVGRRVLSSPVRQQLRGIPGYLIVIDKNANVQFTSEDVSRLSTEDWLTMQRAIEDLPDGQTAGIVRLSSDQALLYAFPVKKQTGDIDRVVAGVRVTGLANWSAKMITTVAVLVPIVIIATTWLVWVFLGTAYARLERVRREVADITDGRSLHRRLSADNAETGAAALIGTINAMITRLETSFGTLRRFTADASHELKTPLTVMRADLERAMNEATGERERMVALEEALHEVTRMSDLVESLLTLARADEGRFALDRKEFNLTELVQEVYETALILGEGADVTVTLPFSADVMITGDRTRLRQLFLNLVTNAIKYTPAGGRVDLGLGRHADNVTFAVRDTGIGIAAAELPYVFDRFWRADHARSRMAERGGFGLGLAISQWIAHAHGGTLTVSSRLGKGSLFTVTLPLHDEEKEVVNSSTLNVRPIPA